MEVESPVLREHFEAISYVAYTNIQIVMKYNKSTLMIPDIFKYIGIGIIVTLMNKLAQKKASNKSRHFQYYKLR